MSILGRRKNPGPQREPHPDPRVEAQLQRVISAQAAIARKNLAADAAMQQAAKAATESGRVSAHGKSNCNAYAAQAAALMRSAAMLEEEIAEEHDEIAKIMEGLGDDALFLVPAPVRTRARAREEGR